MKNKRILLLLVFSMLLGGFYFGYLRPYLRENSLIEELQHKIFRPHTNDINYIRIQAGTEPPYTLKKTIEGWMITSPRRLKPDTGAVAFFLKTLSEGKALKVVGHARSLLDFGLSKLYAVIAIGYGGTIEVLHLGGENPAGTGNYAFSESLKTVFLIDKDTARHLYMRLFDMREKRPFPYPKEKINGIVIEREDTTLDFVRSKDGWLMIKPVRLRANSTEIDKLLEIITTQKAEAFFEWNREIERLKKRMKIRLMDAEGRIISSGELRYWGPDANKQTVFKRDDNSEEAMRVSRAFWLELDHHPSLYADGMVFSAVERERIRAIIIKEEKDEFSFQRQKQGWLYKGKYYKEEQIFPVIDEIINLTFERILFKKRYKPGKVFLMIEILTDEGLQRLQVYSVDLRKEITSSFMFVPGVPGVSESRPVYYWLSEKEGLPYQGVITSEQVRTLRELLNEYVSE